MVKKRPATIITVLVILIIALFVFLGISGIRTVKPYMAEYKAKKYLRNKYSRDFYQHGPVEEKNGSYYVNFYFGDTLEGGMDVTVEMNTDLKGIIDNYRSAQQWHIQAEKDRTAERMLAEKFKAETDELLKDSSISIEQIQVFGVENARDNMTCDDLEKLCEKGLNAYIFMRFSITETPNYETDAEAAYNVVKYLKDRNVFPTVNFYSDKLIKETVIFYDDPSFKSDELLTEEIEKRIYEIYYAENDNDK